MKFRQFGFSLLEAIVALTILSTSSIALYSWLGTSLNVLERVDEVYEVSEVLRNFEAHLSSMNLQSETTESYRINGYEVRWQARLLEPKQRARAGVDGSGKFDIGLYGIEGKIYDGSKLIGEFSTRLVGYQLREMTGRPR